MIYRSAVIIQLVVAALSAQLILCVGSTQHASVAVGRRRWRLPSFFGRRKAVTDRNHIVVDGNIRSTTLEDTNGGVTPESTTLLRNNTTGDGVMDSIPSWKLELPPILQAKGPKTLQKLNMGEAAEIYLLGTAHVSNDSSTDVKLLLEAVNPDCIFVELCEARIALLEGTEAATEAMRNSSNSCTLENESKRKAKPSFWEKLNDIQQSQGGSRLQALSTLLLTSVQEDYAEALDVELGGEFRAAHKYWIAQNQAAVASAINSQTNAMAPSPTVPSPKPVSMVLGDRPLSLTLVRAWESLWWWPKTKVIVGLLLSSFQKPNPDEIRAWLESVLREESDVLTQSLQELRQHFPTLHSTIIAERDAWLSSKLVQTCRVLSQQYHLEPKLQQQAVQSSSSSTSSSSFLLQSSTKLPKKRIVAIVGAGHVPGIVQWLTGNVTSSLSAASPEEVLVNLTYTKRWEKDDMVQKEMMPQWINEVTEVHRHENDWSWAEPSMAALP
ncbi:hypothetical protein ACA910_008333 [Epithemia clementina (nom. ined.)]